MTSIPPVLSTTVILRLQGTIGNCAVCRLLSATTPEPLLAPEIEANVEAGPGALLPSAVPAPTPALAQRLASAWRRLSHRPGDRTS